MHLWQCSHWIHMWKWLTKIIVQSIESKHSGIFDIRGGYFASLAGRTHFRKTHHNNNKFKYDFIGFQWISHPREIQQEQEEKKESNPFEFRDLVSLSRKYHIGLEELRELRHEFSCYDPNHNGAISKEAFQNLIRTRCKVASFTSVPPHLLLASKKVATAGLGSELACFCFEDWQSHSLVISLSNFPGVV